MRPFPTPECYAALAERQHGIVTRGQLLSLGVGDDRLRRWVAAGILVREHRTVYRVGGAPRTARSALLAACLAMGGVASHRSAGWLWRLDGFGPDEPHVVVDHRRRYRPTSCHLHRSTDLELAKVTWIDGIPVTGIDRTLLDVGLDLGPMRLDRVAEAAVRRRQTTWDAITDTFVEHARRGRGGSAAMREVLIERELVHPALESRLEVEFWRLVQSVKLAVPEPQVEVFDAGGFVARVDFAYVDLRIAIQLDGKEFHLTPEAFEHDREQRARLRAAGWIVLEFTWDMVVRRPEYVVQALRQALQSRRAVG